MKEIDTSAAFEVTRGWLDTPLGQHLLAQESQIVESVLDGLFGEQCLQLGLWGEPRTFLQFARTQQAACIASPANALKAESPSVYGRIHRLPVAADSIDVVILPHTLDFSGRPHEILREVHRVLRSDGHLVVLGFKPGGLWGLRRLIPGAGLPPNMHHAISDRQLSDWVKLLDLHIHGLTRHFFHWHLNVGWNLPIRSGTTCRAGLKLMIQPHQPNQPMPPRWRPQMVPINRAALRLPPPSSSSPTGCASGLRT